MGLIRVAVAVKTVLDPHFGAGASPKFSGDWDVHWGYGILTHGRTKRAYCGWTNSISHRFETKGNHGWNQQKPGFLRWCRISSIHSRFQALLRLGSCRNYHLGFVKGGIFPRNKKLLEYNLGVQFNCLVLLELSFKIGFELLEFPFDLVLLELPFDLELSFDWIRIAGAVFHLI